MGTFKVPMQVSDLHASRFVTVVALVDTGATYPVVPRPVLESLRIQPVERRPFEMADGRIVEHDVGGILLRVEDRTVPVLCAFGRADSQPLLGAVALESLGLAPDPVHLKLVPVNGLLM